MNYFVTDNEKYKSADVQIDLYVKDYSEEEWKTLDGLIALQCAMTLCHDAYQNGFGYNNFSGELLYLHSLGLFSGMFIEDIEDYICHQPGNDDLDELLYGVVQYAIEKERSDEGFKKIKVDVYSYGITDKSYDMLRDDAMEGEDFNWDHVKFVKREKKVEKDEFIFYKSADLVALIDENGHLDIPANITQIDENAFTDCKTLKSVTIPEGVTSIGKSAFSNCFLLENVVIPKSVSMIGRSAFHGCNYLKQAIIPEGVTYLDHSTFNGCSSLARIKLPESLTSIGRFAFGGCSSLKSIKLPRHLASIGENAFYECSSLESIIIPRITELGGVSFCNCVSLKSVVIQEGITSVSRYAFYGCKSLESVVLPISVKSIGAHAFHGCKFLKDFEIPESVTSIDAKAFYGCKIPAYTSDRIKNLIRDSNKKDEVFKSNDLNESIRFYRPRMKESHNDYEPLRTIKFWPIGSGLYEVYISGVKSGVFDEDDYNKLHMYEEEFLEKFKSLLDN